MPGLQRESCRQCVGCGAAASAYCARCGVTPYCSAHCQRRDWADRHKAVCHNLARLASHNKPAPDLSNLPRAPPLRQPHATSSPLAQAHEREAARNDESGSERGHKNYRQGDRNNANTSNRNNNRNFNKFTKKPTGRQQSKENSRDDTEAMEDDRQPQQQEQQPQQQQNEVPADNTHIETPKPAPKKPGASMPRSPKKAVNIQETVKEEMKPTPPEVEKDVPVKAELPAADEPKLTPKTYLIEHLSIGDSVLLSVDQVASQCRTSRPGFVCLAMHEKFEEDYQKLCEDYVLDCEANTTPYTVSPGESLSYLNPEDSGWYRARCLAPSTVALLDASKVLQIKPGDKCKSLPPKYQHIPEFSCILDTKDVEVGANIKCTLQSKTANGYKVAVHDVETDSKIGSGELMRWIPDVEYPVDPKLVVAVCGQVPEVSRPALVGGARVIVCDVSDARVCVRPAHTHHQRQFHALVDDVALYGTTARALGAAPAAGALVVARCSDGLHYRALVQRTNVAADKYKIHYLEYGNVEVTKLECLFPCPSKFATAALSSVLALDAGAALTAAAHEYLQQLKEQLVLLTLPDGAETAPSGSVANLIVLKNKEDVTEKLRQLCKPQWKKIEEQGGDVVETQCIMYEEMPCVELAAGDSVLDVLDVSLLDDGTLAVCPRTGAHVRHVSTTLAHRMAEYCESTLGKKPYLPKLMEMCIAKNPPSGQWYRAVLMEQPGGPGAESARVLCVDTGRVELVPVAMIRKMMPEFVTDLPALACHLQIKDFPQPVTQDMLNKARRFMKLDELGRGEIAVRNCVKLDDGLFSAEAPLLLRAMQ